jgi:AcrR family transcriptional regulator
MCPRRYATERRQAAAEQTRSRIIDAARALLSADGGVSGFTIDAVAEQAGVARMTVYYQFGSKGGLLEALLDDIARRGGIDNMAGAFSQTDPVLALHAFIGVLGHLFTADRLVLRRLRALAVLDPDFEAAMQGRDQRRYEGLRVLVQRLAGGRARRATTTNPTEVEILHALTSFETFDALAGPTRNPEEVVPTVQFLASRVLGLKEK